MAQAYAAIFLVTKPTSVCEEVPVSHRLLLVVPSLHNDYDDHYDDEEDRYGNAEPNIHGDVLIVLCFRRFCNSSEQIAHKHKTITST